MLCGGIEDDGRCENKAEGQGERGRNDVLSNVKSSNVLPQGLPFAFITGQTTERAPASHNCRTPARRLNTLISSHPQPSPESKVKCDMAMSLNT